MRIILCCILFYITFGMTQEPIQPITSDTIVYDEKKAAIGRLLFFDPRLSGSSRLSCSSCHDPYKGGADPNQQLSIGDNGQRLEINTPTILTAPLNFRQFWDGRSENLEEQVGFVLINPIEMNSNWPDVLQKINQDELYIKAFNEVYKSAATELNISNALAEYQRSLVKPSAFDAYLLGDEMAITEEAKEGYKLFKRYGCVGCHQGINIGGNMYQYFGILGNYFELRGDIKESDYGRFNVTKKEKDRYVFKVPTLRNIALTAPYLHDGSAKNLKTVVDIMFKYQLGRTAPEDDKEKIIRFMESLNSLMDE